MKPTYTTLAVREIINIKYNGNIFLPDTFEYKGVDEPETFVCIKHGNFISTVYRMKHTQTKYGCNKCAPNSRKGWPSIKKKIIQTHGLRYDYSLNEKEYNSKNKLKIICKTHGLFEQSYSDHVKGGGCPTCYKSHKETSINDFLYDSIKIHGNAYSYEYVFDDFVNTLSKIRIICEKHGMFQQNANDHRKGAGCPACKVVSTGENIIRVFLVRNGIDFISQKTFDDCIRIKRKCRYDFYIPSRNCLIEFDGIQHNELTFRCRDNSDIIENDKFKTEYAFRNNIKLIRIKHNEDIEQKLSFLVE